ncbi:MAG TPA: FecR domain-containing protein [Steroidobacteraceae bacterium]|nr:FecR domain-containing protein [Steroidobacteraceae bacterium]
MSRNGPPGMLAWIVLRATSLVPEPMCYRLEEEWLADLFALDGLVRRVYFALGCWWAALQMRGERITGIRTKVESRSFIDELPAARPGFELKLPLFKKRHRVREDAFTWLERLRRGLKDDETTRFRTWLKRRSHRECIARVAAQRDNFEDLAFLNEVCEINPAWIESRPVRNRAINAVAALISFGIVSIPYVHLVLPQGSFIEGFGTAYTSGGHELRRIGLPDGTHMVLNRGTHTAVWYTETMRAAAVLRGEATFTVAHETFRAFLVDAGDRHFASMGGTFNIRVSGGVIELTVLKGEVSVTAPPVQEQSKGHAEPIPATVLKADQTIAISPGNQSARTLSPLQTQARIAWQQG